MSDQSVIQSSLETGGVDPLGYAKVEKMAGTPPTTMVNPIDGTLMLDTTGKAVYCKLETLSGAATWVPLGGTSSAFASNAETVAGVLANVVVAPSTLKAKLGAQTNHGVLVGAGTTAAVTALAVGGANSVLAGAAGADPAFTATPTLTTLNTTGAIVAGTTVTATAGAIVAATNVTATTGAVLAGTTVTATLGAITATNGNVVLGTAGNKIMSTSVGAAAAAGANSFGKVTLVAGTVVVATTAVTANSIIMLTRQGIGATGAAALGMLSVGTIVAATSFVINSLTTADATTPLATDVSSIGWMIIN